MVGAPICGFGASFLQSKVGVLEVDKAVVISACAARTLPMAWDSCKQAEMKTEINNELGAELYCVAQLLAEC